VPVRDEVVRQGLHSSPRHYAALQKGDRSIRTGSIPFIFQAAVTSVKVAPYIV
jgi:hypothetical protein